MHDTLTAAVCLCLCMRHAGLFGSHDSCIGFAKLKAALKALAKSATFPQPRTDASVSAPHNGINAVA